MSDTNNDRLEAITFKMCKKYYPRLWPIKSVKALVDNGRLSEEHYKEVTGFTYPNIE